MAYDILGFLHGSNGTPVSATTTTTGTGVDLKSGTPKRGLTFNWRVYTLTGTSPTLDFKIQCSSDNTTFTDLAVPEGGQVTASGALRQATVYTSKRYVRSIATTGGTVTAASYDCVIGNCQP